MDKRTVARIFRSRLLTLIARSRQNRSSFAMEVGIDRSALSQLLSEDAVRLPRADTLVQIARHHGVSVDWLLGMSEGGEAERPDAAPDVPGLEIAESGTYHNVPLLTHWHAEATGTKIRYVPHRLPDMLRTPEIVAYELRDAEDGAAQAAGEIARNLDFKRRPGTDMEVCMSVQALDALVTGAFPWDGLSRSVRQVQIRHMARLVEDLYPSFRIFLFDERARHSVPYTIFGSQRVAIYAGSMYLVLNAPETIMRMQRHFEQLIRHATVHPHDVAAYFRRQERRLDIALDTGQIIVPPGCVS
ncbi:helix-turn-helix domain-containing protein [Gluconacetobacter tumulisoli]|uniref:Helix-turn-helix transcriptional regulator n=1 Tax=Gluconacetobacter tumulisoli TaxID=1286189 RepID=A0A7W4KA68_9PROT|nr:helix-turn-helix domain-containing protein [Gluconacetobacter tumulisoli]MBB2203206.1 helix-turn-helix transcriptional regulator [Gluconacetobacter tumulisoli]